jgi:DNA-binding CsgD family transcriptional regulator
MHIISTVTYLRSTPPCSFDILCGKVAPALKISTKLESWGFPLDTKATVKVVLDAPLGFALRTLERFNITSPWHVRNLHDAPRLPQLRSVVWTSNLCGEYLEDLWSFRPGVLLVDNGYSADETLRQDQMLAEAIVRVSRGENYRITPDYHTPLSPTERRVLRYVACGLSNEDVAAKLAMQEKTIRNVLTRVYDKFQLSSRTQAELYYWGLWQVLTDEVRSVDLRNLADRKDVSYGY